MDSYGFRGFEISTVIVGVDIEAVWDRVETWQGVNYELSPLVRMTAPAAYPRVSDIPADGEIHFTSYILLFGVLPIDAHRFALRAREAPFYFDERSHNSLIKVWTHRRSLEAVEGGVRVTDHCTIKPRLYLTGGLLGFIYRQIFRHRHRRLKRYFARRPS